MEESNVNATQTSQDTWSEFNDCLDRMLKILDEHDLMTGGELWESGYSAGVSDARDRELIHDLWHSAINLMCWNKGEQLLTAECLKKPLSSSHRGYKFHCHHYPPVRDKRNELQRINFDLRNKLLDYENRAEMAQKKYKKQEKKLMDQLEREKKMADDCFPF